MSSWTELNGATISSIDNTRIIQYGSSGLLVENTSTSQSLGIGPQVIQINGTINIDPLNLTAIAPNPTPTELVINNDLIVQDDDTAPDNIISIQSGVIGVGTNFGIDYESSTNQDFTIQTTNSNTGGVLFKQYGLGATTTQSKIKQGIITCNDTANTNSITIDASNNQIVITDGTNTNTINKNGYTTRNSVQNATHYLNFSDNSATGVGAIQKTAGISCNPSTNTITATTFSGTATNATNVATTSTTTNATYYPTFVSATSGNNGINVDTTLTYNPSTDTLTCANLAGTATNSTNAVIGLDNASTLVYPVFVKTSGAGNKGLFIDDTITPLQFNPSTGALTTTSFVASSAGSTNTIGTGSMVISNAGGTLTANQGAYSTTASTLSINAGTSLQLQIASSTLGILNTTSFRIYKPLYLDDNNSHQSILDANWFSTASVNSTNLYQPSAITKELNIGALGSAGSITPYPFSALRKYATTHNSYTSSTDTTPLLITGTDTTKTIKTTSASNNTTTTISAETTASGGGNSKLILNSSTTNVPTAQFKIDNYLGNTTTLNLKTTQADLFAGTPNSESMIVSGVQTGSSTTLYYDPDAYATSSVYLMNINSSGLLYGTANVASFYPDANPNLSGISNTYLTINTSGITTPTTLQLPTGTTTLNFSGSVAINGQSKTFEYFNMRATGTTNTITGFSFVNMPQNAVYTIAILNSGSGNLTINAPTGIRTNYTTSFVVPTGRYATLIARYLYFGTASYYCLEATLLQTN